MTRLAQNQEWELTVEFINKTALRQLSGNRWVYTGKTKKEVINKVKQDGRYNSSYAKKIRIVDID